MMKRKLSGMPIRFKIWLAIMGIVVAFLLLLWGLQVVFLRPYYVGLKRTELSALTEQITQIIDEKGLVYAKGDLVTVVEQERLCIEVVGSDDLVLTLEGLPFDCYLHQYDTEAHRTLVEEARRTGRSSIRTVTAYRPVSDTSDYMISVVSNPKYVLVITQELAPVYEAIEVTINQLTWISILLIILATIVAFIFARSFTKPITRLTEAAQEIAKGNLEERVPVNRGDELGELAQNFNYMALELGKINQLERELVANLSHDIRTPLTMIRGYAEMIKDITGENKQQREEQLDIIVDETNRLSRLASDALDLSRLQAGQIVMKPQSFDMAQKLRDIVSRYSLLEQTEGFRFECNTPESCMVYADETRIEQVLYNLLNNAVNHIGEDKCVILELKTDKDTAWVSVQDHGTGIAPEDLPLIWDRYYKPYYKDRPGMGTGLGLSIVKAVLVGHNAPYGVNSKPGEGSSFWFGLNIMKETKNPKGMI